MSANGETDDLDLRGLPPAISMYGKRLKAIGRGKFPYECRAKDQHPNAMIYFSPDAGWTHEHNKDTKAAIQREAVEEGGDDANRS